MYRLYRLPDHGEQTVLGCDTSEGGDLSAFVVKSKRHCDSFLVFSAHVNSAELAEMLRRAFMLIKQTTGYFPWIGIERNMGMSTINKLLEWHYPKLYRQKTFDERSQKWIDKVGWWMKAGNRAKMLDELELAIRSGETIIYDLETIDQMLTFVRNKSSGKPEAESGCFDDLVIAEGIALQLWYTTPLDDRQAGPVKAISPEMADKPFKTIPEKDRVWKYDLEELKRLKPPRDWRAV